MNEFQSKIYDRRIVDMEVYRRFQENGNILKMTINQKDLNKDTAFWESEASI